MIILLDTGPLGLITHPKASAENRKCLLWMAKLVNQGAQFYVPEISDYELRRELLRRDAKNALKRLDELIAKIGFAPIKSSVVRKAAEFWAHARNIGKKTADDKAIDGDMFLVAHAVDLQNSGESVVIATTNTKHISLFADARLWQDISLH